MKLDSFYNKNRLYILSILIFAIFIYSIINFEEIMAATTAMIYSIAGIFLVNYIDDKVLNVDTKKEISEKGNMAYAIVFMGYCIIVAAGLLSSSLVFFSLK